MAASSVQKSVPDKTKNTCFTLHMRSSVKLTPVELF